MKDCSILKDAIAGHALGKTPEPRVAAHLAICPRCRSALRESRAMAALIDEALHRAAAVEPPVSGPERVMSRVHVGPPRRSNTLVWGNWGWWRWAAAGSAGLVVLIATLIWVRRPAPEADIKPLFTWRSPTQSLLRPPVAAAWAATPRLGEGFFKMKPFFKIEPSGEAHAK